ncbi:MAG: hypothetical protein QM731_04140 [Chitinophagaceae bacterium]
MKHLSNKIILSALAVCVTAMANAQEYKSNVSISEQLKGNTVPGLNYTAARHVTAAASIKPNEGKESQVQQIKKGTAKGMKFMPVTAARTVQPAARALARTGSLPSDRQAQKVTTPSPVGNVPVMQDGKEPAAAIALPAPVIVQPVKTPPANNN